MAAVLSLPCLGLGYFWDDFVFLARVQANPLSALGPEPGAFYRPLPRALYFWPLASMGSSGAIVAHLANLALVAASILLLVTLARDLAGDRAGAGAGLLFAGLAPAPSLVAWASGSQDLLAITFVLAALHLRNSGRILPSAILAAAALLSKETAVCAIPVLVLWDWLLGRKPARITTGMVGYGGLAIVWILLHPGVRGLAMRGFMRQPRAYVGFSNLAVSEFHARQYLLALANVPASFSAWAWPSARAALLLPALALALFGMWIAARRGAPEGIASRGRTHEQRAPQLSIPRAAALGILITLPALALPSLLIQRWAAYFICMPALGVSLFLGVVLSRVPLAVAMTAIAAYVGLGFWSRQLDHPGADTLTEKSFFEASHAIREVETGFRALHSTFPRHSQVLLSVASSGLLGIDGTMHDGQALRTWYRDPTIRTLRPERRLARPAPPGAEYLVRITESRDVVEIDPDLGTLRSSGGDPDPEEMRAITRTYARGLAASGETDRAVRILSRLAAGDDPTLRSYDLRLAAMGRMAEGDRVGAARLLAEAPPISRESALYDVSKVMAEPTGRADLDSCAYSAFGISSSDPGALRYLMQLFYGSLFVPQAVSLARRLQEVAPGDSESAAILSELR